MSVPDDDPVCPECGGPIGMTSTYCMHCSADLTDLRESEASDSDRGRRDSTDAVGGPTGGAATTSSFGGVTNAVGQSVPTPRNLLEAVRSFGGLPRGRLFGDDPIMNAVILIVAAVVWVSVWLVSYLLLVPTLSGTAGLVVAAVLGIVAALATAIYIPA